MSLLSTIPQITDTELNPVKGLFGTSYLLEKSLPIKDGEEIVKGRVITQDPTTEKWVLGLVDEDALPYFAFNGNQAGDFDGAPDPGNMIEGKIVGICALAAVELQSTEVLDDTYVVGTPLTVHLTAGADKGKLKKTTFGSGLAIVGIVTAPDRDRPAGEAAGTLQTNENRKLWVQFTACYIPGALNHA